MIKSATEPTDLPPATFNMTTSLSHKELAIPTTLFETAAVENSVIHISEFKTTSLSSKKWKKLRILIENGDWEQSEQSFFGQLLLLLLERRQFELAGMLANKDAPIDFNYTTLKNNRSALHVSISNKAPLDLISLLIQKGGNINAQDDEGNTPLHVARKADTVALLMRAGADLSIKDKIGWTPVQVAAYFSHQCFEALLINAPEAKDDNAQFGMALMTMINVKAYSLGIKILRLRSVIALCSYYDYLSKAISKNAPLELVTLLLKRGAPQYGKESLLQRAISLNRADIVALLVNYRAYLRNLNLNKSVRFAARSGRFSCLEAILDNASGAMQDKKGQKSIGKALLEVLLCGQFPLARKILKNYKVIVSCRTFEGSQPLHVAVLWKSSLDIIAMLVRSGADIFAKDNNDRTPLSLAQERGFHLITSVLKNPNIHIINARAVQEFFHLYYLGQWRISTLPKEILSHIASYLVEEETIEELLRTAIICSERTLKEWWQTRQVSVENKQRYYWHLRDEYGNVPKAIEEALNVLEGIEELNFPSKIANLCFGSHERALFRTQQIMKLSRLLIYRKYSSPLAYYLRGVYGPNGESYLKIALDLHDQKQVWKLSPGQRADLEFRLASADSGFSDWEYIK